MKPDDMNGTGKKLNAAIERQPAKEGTERGRQLNLVREIKPLAVLTVLAALVLLLSSPFL